MSDSNFAHQTVPQEQRKSLLSLIFLMLGLTFFSASMWAGGNLGNGLSFDLTLLAIGIGNVVLSIYTALLGYIGAKTGLSTHLLSRFAFGEKGAWLPSALLSITQVGWFGVGVAMFALPVNKLTGVDLELLVCLSGILMTSTVYFGISALVFLSCFAIPAITLLGGFSLSMAIESAGGLSTLFDHQPKETMNFTVALSIVIGSFISAGTLTADFLRYAKNPKAAVFVAICAFFIGNSLMFLFGAVGALVTGQSDISDVMMIQGLLIPAIIVLGLNIWTTNDNALYAAGLGFSSITGKPSQLISVVCGILGTLFSLWLYNHFVDWLIFLSTAIPPLGGVLILDYFLHKSHYRNFAQREAVSFKWEALLSVLTGIVAAYFIAGIQPLIAISVSSISYFLLIKVASLRAFKFNRKQ